MWQKDQDEYEVNSCGSPEPYSKQDEYCGSTKVLKGQSSVFNPEGLGSSRNITDMSPNTMVSITNSNNANNRALKTLYNSQLAPLTSRYGDSKPMSQGGVVPQLSNFDRSGYGSNFLPPLSVTNRTGDHGESSG